MAALATPSLQSGLAIIRAGRFKGGCFFDRFKGCRVGQYFWEFVGNGDQELRKVEYGDVSVGPATLGLIDIDRGLFRSRKFSSQPSPVEFGPEAAPVLVSLRGLCGTSR